MELIPLSECFIGKVYKLRSRNLKYGVYVGNGSFVGIRAKWGSRFLDTEYHWDWGDGKSGTVKAMEEVHPFESNPLHKFMEEFENNG